MRPNIKSILPIIAAVITLIMAVSCGHRPTRDALARADALIDQHEDSAMAVLLTIDTTRLSGRRDHALYGLLMTQALVKLHQPVASDSLIAPAARFFAAGSDRHHAMRALYYHGVVKYDNEQYPEALVLFFQARDIATDLGDNFWLGLSSRGISSVYNQTNRFTEELHYSKNEYDAMFKTGRWNYIRYAKLNLARAHFRKENYGLSEQLAKELIDTANYVEDSYLEYEAMKIFGCDLLAQERYSQAFPLFENICKTEYAEFNDSLYLADSYIGANMPDYALALFEGKDYIPNDYSILVCYRSFRKLGLKDEALEEIDRYLSAKFDDLYHKMGYNLSNPVFDYFVETHKMTKTQLETAKIRGWLIFAIALICLIIISWITVHIVERQRKKIDEQLRITSELQSFLNQSRERNKETDQLIKQIFASKYELLTSLCSELISVPDNRGAQKRLVKDVMELIDQFANDRQKINELIDFVNKAHDGVFDDFRRDLPNLKDIDYRLFLFTCYKFSAPLIAAFLKEDNINSIYERKRRLKNKIKQLPFSSSVKYMIFFD